MSNSEVLVEVDGVSKRYCRDFLRSMRYGFQDFATDLTGRSPASDLRKGEFWAVDEVSFQLRRGEALGLIGANGAGKTTLLKMINGVIRPDSGEIRICGSVGGLIALGAGFHPVLTGRENVFINAAIMGIPRAVVRDKLDAIVDFAEIGDAIDAPVQTYSSGMQVRLGFATAIQLIKPDVLLLDEVLAVGDIGFVIRCLNAVRELLADSATIFVSHNIQHIARLCSRTVLLSHGRCIFDGDVRDGIDLYMGEFQPDTSVSGNGLAKIYDAEVSSPCFSDKSMRVVGPDDDLSLSFQFEISEFFRDLAILKVHVVDNAMTPVVTFLIDECDGTTMEFSSGTHEVEIPMNELHLRAGKYSCVVIILDKNSSVTLGRVQGIGQFQVAAHNMEWGNIVRRVVPTLQSPHTM